MKDVGFGDRWPPFRYRIAGARCGVKRLAYILMIVCLIENKYKLSARTGMLVQTVSCYLLEENKAYKRRISTRMCKNLIFLKFYMVKYSSRYQLL